MTPAALAATIRSAALASLPAAATKVYVTLAAHANQADLAWPSVETLARETGASVRTVQRSLRALEDHQLIEPTCDRPCGRGRSVAYRIIPIEAPRRAGTPSPSEGTGPLPFGKGDKRVTFWAVKGDILSQKGDTSVTPKVKDEDLKPNDDGGVVCVVEPKETLMDAIAAAEMLQDPKLGFDEPDARRVVAQFGPQVVRQAAEITLWALRQGVTKITSPRGYLITMAKRLARGEHIDNPAEQARRREAEAQAARDAAEALKRRRAEEAEARREALERETEQGRTLWSSLSYDQREAMKRNTLARLDPDHVARPLVEAWNPQNPPSGLVLAVIDAA